MTERRAGRHRPARQSRKVWPIVAGAAVVCVAAGGTAWGLSRGGGDSTDGTHSTTASSLRTPATSPTTPVTSATTPTAPGTSSSSPSSRQTIAATTPSVTSTRSVELAKLTACRATIGAGQKLVAASDKNYADWSGHVYAQTDYDKGRISSEQAHAIWDRTKKAGPGDLSQYDTAKKAWDKADQKACTGLRSGAGASQQTVRKCSDRSAAMLDVLKKAEPVYAEWKGHQTQMTHTEEKSKDPDAYFTEWFGRVHNAEKPLAAYKKAQTAYRKTAACPST